MMRRIVALARRGGLIALAAFGIVIPACDRQRARRPQAAKSATQVETHGELIRSVGENINHLEEFHVGRMIPQVRDRLNQWVINEQPTVEWRLDPMLAELPPQYAELADVRVLGLARYSDQDVFFLQQAVWLAPYRSPGAGGRV